MPIPNDSSRPQTPVPDGRPRPGAAVSAAGPARAAARIVIPAAALLLLAWWLPAPGAPVAPDTYLPLHTLVETFAIVVSMLVFGIGWTTRGAHQSATTVTLTATFLAVGLLDFAHMMSYEGMPAFITPASAHKAILFWLAARALAALGLLAAVLLPPRPGSRRLGAHGAVACALAVTAALYWLGLYHEPDLPATFVAGAGLTPFKIGTEYAIIALNLATAAALLARRHAGSGLDAGRLLAAVGVMALGEICFTLYTTVSDLANVLGHLYKVAAYFLIYQALFVDNVRRPYRLLHRSEEALREHAENFRALTENSHDAIAILSGPEATPVFVNRRCAEMLGYSTAELRALRLADVVPPPEYRVLLERYRRRLGNQPEPGLYQSRVRRKDGTIVNVEIAGARAVWRGQPADVVTVRDVTARVRAERELRLHSSVLEQMPGSVIVTGRAGIIEYVNPAFERTTGYAAAEAIGRKPNLIKSGVHPPEFFARLWQTILAGETFRDVLTNRRKDGTLYYEDKTITPVRGDQGEITHFVSIGKDITDRVRSEEALRESEARFRSLTELSSDWYWEQDEQLRFTTVTRREDADERFPPEDHYGRTRWELPYLDVPPEVWEEHRRTLAERRPFRDLILKRRDRQGRIRYSSISGEPVFDAQGRFRGYRGIGRDITERVMADEQLAQLAYYDSLTGLPNRALLRDRLHQTMIDADRQQRLVAILFMDLDRFKFINDSLGHAAGDALLKAVAERLRACVRSGDTIARLGGDEFTIVLAGIEHIDHVALIAQKLLEQFAAPFVIDGNELYTNASIGITLYPWDDSDIDTLLKNADAAMYHAKESGRGTFQFYTAELNQRARSRLELETALRQALERREFTLHYQPMVDLETGRIAGAEALLRWERPGQGLVPPMEFIPLAEDTGLILPIGEWVLRTACAHAQAWARAGHPDLQLAVNLSGRQLTKRLPRLVHEVLEETRLPPARLDLELTESLLMRDLESTAALMNELHALGVSCSMDDFGTGYSSLSYLKRFPIDFLKVDRSFVRDIPHDPDDTAITRAIIAMAHTMDIKVVAEGVETRDQFEFLRTQDCDLIQGYYCSAPLDADAFAALLHRWQPLEFTADRDRAAPRRS